MNQRNTVNKWERRAHRMQRRILLAGSDVRRSAAWHIGGGRRFFGRYSRDVIENHKWCFVVGCNNSGTSLLQSMLESTGRISTFETEGQFYTRVLPRAERRGFERVWMEYKNDLEVGVGEIVQSVPRLAHDWLSALSLPVRQVVVEKTPANVLRMEWLQDAFPNSYFIGLVRNGYAVSEGIRRKGFKSVDRGARHWSEVNKEMLRRSCSVDRFLQINYENLVENYDESIRGLTRFLDIKDDDNRLHEPSKSPIRTDHRVIRNFNAESISRLTKVDCITIRRSAAEMLDHFNYTPEGSEFSSEVAEPESGLE